MNKKVLSLGVMLSLVTTGAFAADVVTTSVNNGDQLSKYQKEAIQLTQQQLAQKLGKNQSTIANKLRILKLPQSIKESLVENGLTERHARALLKLPNEELMDEVIQKVTKNELTVKKTEKLIKDILESIELENNPEKKQNIKCSMSIRIYLNTLKQAYDAILNTGIEAKYNEIDKGDYMEVVVKIPKK